MKPILLLMILFTFSFASLKNVYSFEADFIQNITDEKSKVLTYSGHIVATKPMYAKWAYLQPIKKDVYINARNVTIVEPEIEQVIIKKIESKFDFFNIVESAKEIKKDIYEAYYQDVKFTIAAHNSIIKSISYLDEFDNQVDIIFTEQKQNINLDLDIFRAKFPLEFDIIRD